MNTNKTYYEAGKYYAVIRLPNGHVYYSGGFNSRSTAYRYAVKETQKHVQAYRMGMIYNTRGM